MKPWEKQVRAVKIKKTKTIQTLTYSNWLRRANESTRCHVNTSVSHKNHDEQLTRFRSLAAPNTTHDLWRIDSHMYPIHQVERKVCVSKENRFIENGWPSVKPQILLTTPTHRPSWSHNALLLAHICCWWLTLSSGKKPDPMLKSSANILEEFKYVINDVAEKKTTHFDCDMLIGPSWCNEHKKNESD